MIYIPDYKKKYPLAKIFAITPLHCDNDEKEINNIGVKRKGGLRSYAEAVKTVASHFGIPVIDAFNDWDMQPIADKENDIYFTADGLHPNDNGHRYIAERLYEFIKEYNLKYLVED